MDEQIFKKGDIVLVEDGVIHNCEGEFIRMVNMNDDLEIYIRYQTLLPSLLHTLSEKAVVVRFDKTAGGATVDGVYGAGYYVQIHYLTLVKRDTNVFEEIRDKWEKRSRYVKSK